MGSVSFELSPAMSETFRDIVRSRQHGMAVIQRAKCVLLAHENKAYAEISEIVGLSVKAVGRWVRRIRDSLAALAHEESKNVKASLIRTIIDCLRDAPRSGRPCIFSPSQVASVISIACEDPEQSGRPVTSWTAREIADEAVLRGVTKSISVAQVQRFLNRAQLQPHKNKGWCFTTEKDQALFQTQVENVCQTYLEAPGLLAEKKILTVSVDEMTSLQANEKRAPTKRPKPGRCGKEECQYTRH